jgi:outer membrane receptor protein involved in Fe transport
MRKIQMSIVVFFAALLLCQSFAIAEEKEEEEVMKLEDIVVTATKTERKKEEVPVSVTVITAEEIKQMSPRDISDVLKEAAGVDVARATPTSPATISLRGLMFNQTSLLIDGQPAEFIMSGWGGKSLLQLPDPDNIERIEIVRGSGSAIYGPSAMGGVINIITKKAPKEKNLTRFSLGYDTLPTWSGGASTGGTLDRFAYSLNFKYEDSEGYKPAPNPALGPWPSTMIHDLQNEDWTSTTIGGRLGYLLSDSDIALTFHRAEDKDNTFGRPNTSKDMKKNNLGLEYKNSLASNDILSVNLSYTDHHGDWNWDSYRYPSNLNTAKTSTTDENARKYTAEVKNQWDITSANTLLVGAIYVRDEIDVKYRNYPANTITSDRRGNVDNLGFYIQDEMGFMEKRLFLTIGARYDTFGYSLKYDDTTTSPETHKDISPTFSAFNPRGAVKFNFTESTALRASVGTGFRAPDTWGLVGGPKSTTSESRANPDLKSEKSMSYDLGIDQKFPFGLKTSLTGYFIEVRDYIMTAVWQEGSAYIYQSQNIGKVEAKGIELELEQEITKKLSGFANYTYNITEAASELKSGTFGLSEKGKALPLHPLHKAGLGLIYNIPNRFNFRIDGVYVSEQYMYGDTKNEPKYKLDPYFVANTKLTYYLPVGENKLDISAGVNNIFDEKYETRFRDYFAEPRVFFAQLGYQF